MKETRKSNLYIYLIMCLLPLLLMLLSCYRTGNYDLISIENTFSVFRTLDFGLSDYIIENALNGTDNVIVLLVFDLCLYKLYFDIIAFAIELFGFIINLAKLIFNKILRGLE